MPTHTRPPQRPLGLRLIALQGFAWGSRKAVPQPRTRAEHVLIWVGQGGLQLDFPGRRHLLPAGTLFFIPASTAFATLPLAGSDGLVLLIAADLTRDLHHPLPDHAKGGPILPGDAMPVHLLRDLADEARRNSGESAAAINCQLSLLSLRLRRLGAARDLPDHDLDHGPEPLPDLPLVERFMTLAQNRLADGSTIADLAQELGVSTACLDEACRQKHDRRAIEMMNQLRLTRAVQMLRETAEPPARIARLLGYASLAHFSRSFVAATGRLPESFRQTSQATSPCG